MGKSLSDHILEQLTLSGAINIKWTQKNSVYNDKSKNSKKMKRSSINIIYADETTIKPRVEKIFKIIKNTKTESKKENTIKKIQTSSAFNYKIIPGFSRKGR